MKRGMKAKERRRIRKRLGVISEGERHFADSPEWAEIIDNTCQELFGHPLKTFLSRFNQGEYYLWPGTHERCEDILKVYILCPQSWFKPELRQQTNWAQPPCEVT